VKKVMVAGLLLLNIQTLFASVRPFISGQIGGYAGNDELESSIIGGGQLGLNGDYLGLSLGGLYYGKDNKVNTMSKGSFNMIPIMLNGFVRIPIKEVAAIRFGGGGSYVLIDHEIDSGIVNEFKRFGIGISEDVESEIGFQVNGGFDVFVTRNISIGADIFYLWVKPELEAKVWDLRNPSDRLSAKNKLELNSVIGLATIKYHFK